MSGTWVALFAAQMLFPTAETTPEAHDGATVRSDGGAAVVEVAPGRAFCGIKFVFRQPLALNRFADLRAEVSNRTDRTLDFVLHGIAPETPRRYAAATFRLAPGAGIVVSASCAPRCFAMADGSESLPGMMGYDCASRPDLIDRSGDIRSVIVFCRPQSAPASFDVKRVWVEGEQPVRALAIRDDFFPFVDEFGQYRHAEWPGKIHSLDELRAAARAEEDDLAAHPASPIPGVDRFGGWGDGPQLTATGLFRTEKWNGRWWLVDPDGHIFFSLGCNYVRLQGRTPVTARERFFSWLPEADDPSFGDCWHVGRHLWLNKCFYQGKGDVAQFDFALANQKRLHGADWKAAFIDRQHRRMRAWGFTSMGNWSDPDIMAADRTPYVDNFNLDGVRKIEGDKKGAWRKFPDVFAPDFAENVRICARKTRLAKSRTDPWCIGWFVENELHWATGHGGGGDLAKSVVGSPPDQPARVEYLRRLKAAHGAAATFADATEADVRAFESEIAERYFSTVKRAIEAVAPGRLYLGCRFCNSYPDAIRAAARHCDVISYNCYDRLPETPRPDTDLVDKPTLIGEFHFGSLDRGMLHAGLVPCRDMADRAAQYKRYVRHALRDANLVGVHWFYWSDMPLTGWMDGEDFGNGLTTVTDTAHPEMVAATRELARDLYRTNETIRPEAVAAPIKAGVFAGNGPMGHSAAEWFRLTHASPDIDATLLDAEAVRSGALDALDLFIMPGGSAIRAKADLGQEGAGRLKAFIRNGGGYIGTCAGCSLLLDPATDPERGIGVIPCARVYASHRPAQLPVTYNAKGAAALGLAPGTYETWYHDGPVLGCSGADIPEAKIETWGTFGGADAGDVDPGMKGRVAVVGGVYGNGRLVATACHPEYFPFSYEQVKGLFRAVTGREVSFPPRRRRAGARPVGVYYHSAAGVASAKTLLALDDEPAVDVVVLDELAVSRGGLDHVDVLILPDGDPANMARYFAPFTKRLMAAFAARGGRVFAWGAGAACLPPGGVVCQDGPATVAVATEGLK